MGYEQAKLRVNGEWRTFDEISQRSLMHSHNIYSGNCLNPVTQRHGWFDQGARFKNYSALGWIVEPEVGVDFYKVRCRTCPNCIKSAKYFWYLRAIDEYETATYSAFGSLTFSERFFARKWRERQKSDQEWLHVHFDDEGIAMTKDEYESAVLASTLDTVPEFDERERQRELELILRELTLCLKRLRKAGWSFRYMAVTEFGTKNGRPHIHFLMNIGRADSYDLHKPYTEFRKAFKENWEHFPGCNCRKNDKGYYVENCRVGWADVRPVRSNYRAAYACKYIGKQRDIVTEDGQVLAASERCRIRASIKFGSRVVDRFSSDVSQ